MRYKKIISAVLCFLVLWSGELVSVSPLSENLIKRLNRMPVLKVFLSALSAQYPSKTFALCVTQDYFPLIVDAAYIQPAPEELLPLTRAHDGAYGSHEEIIVSAESALNVPLTAFHAASMSANGYSEMPRPAKIVIQARVLSRPQEQQTVVSPSPQGHIRPSVPNSPWRSIGDSEILFWVFAAVLPSV